MMRWRMRVLWYRFAERRIPREVAAWLFTSGSAPR